MIIGPIVGLIITNMIIGYVNITPGRLDKAAILNSYIG